MPDQRPQSPGPTTLGRRWKRTIGGATAALLLLVGGAIVNVAVAWGGALVCEWSPLQLRSGEEPWPLPAPAHWPQGSRVAAADRALFSAMRHWNDKIASEDDESDWAGDFFQFDYLHFGWPLRSLRAEYWYELSIYENPDRMVERRDRFHQISTWRMGLPTTRSIGRVPLLPLWPGFIINTIFYALLLWLLFFTPLATRRMLRRRRGLCEKCAYPIGVSPVCTECGAAVRLRSEGAQECSHG